MWCWIVLFGVSLAGWPIHPNHQYFTSYYIPPGQCNLANGLTQAMPKGVLVQRRDARPAPERPLLAHSSGDGRRGPG